MHVADGVAKNAAGFAVVSENADWRAPTVGSQLAGPYGEAGGFVECDECAFVAAGGFTDIEDNQVADIVFPDERGGQEPAV